LDPAIENSIPGIAVTSGYCWLICCGQGLDFVKQLTSMLRKHCEMCAPALLDKFDNIINDEDLHVGLIVNERIINIPPQISPPSFDALRYACEFNS